VIHVGGLSGRNRLLAGFYDAGRRPAAGSKVCPTRRNGPQNHWKSA